MEMFKIEKVFILQGRGMDEIQINTPHNKYSPCYSTHQVFKTYVQSGTGVYYVENVLKFKDYEVIDIK